MKHSSLLQQSRQGITIKKQVGRAAEEGGKSFCASVKTITHFAQLF
jgi:hypothetical protein